MATEFDSLHKISTAWERELGFELSESWWDKVILSIRSSTPCTRLQLLHFKVIDSTSLNPVQLKSFLQFQTSVTDAKSHPAT